MQKDGTLSMPDVPVVPYITGDGVGAEVTPSMQSVVNAAVQKAYGGKRRIEWKEVLAGERAFNETGSWLPDETMKAFQEYLIGIKVAADDPCRRWNPFFERGFAPNSGFVCLSASGPLVSRRSFSGESTGKSEHVRVP